MNLAQIDLNLLLALEALLAERNLTRAGQRLGLSQPSMSRALEQLRRIFDDQLLVRVGREYQATPLAVELQEPLARALSQLTDVVRMRLAFDPTRDERLFRVAASNEGILLILRPLIQRLTTVYPFVSLLIRRLDGRFMVRALEAGELDLGIWPSSVRTSGLETEVLYEDDWVLATWQGSGIDPATLPQEQLARLSIAFDPESEDNTGLERTGLVTNPPSVLTAAQPQLTFTGPSLRLLLLRGTPMVNLTHRKLATYMREIADLQIHQPPFETPKIGTAMFWHRSREGDPALIWLREEIRSIIAAPGFGEPPCDGPPFAAEW